MLYNVQIDEDESLYVAADSLESALAKINAYLRTEDEDNGALPSVTSIVLVSDEDPIA